MTTTLQRAWRQLMAGSPPAPLRELAILTMPRTGSSYYCDCLGSLPGVTMLREIFNPRGYAPVIKMARRRFETILGSELAGADDRDLHHYFLDHPVEAIDALAAAATEERAALMVYKVIGHQLERPKLAAILEQRRPKIVILARRRLDVWISISKAQAIGKWHNRDTKDVDVAIDIDQFMEWSQASDDWYRYAVELTVGFGLEAKILDYDRDVDRPLPELRHTTIGLLAELGIQLPRRGGTSLRIRERQDARTDPFSKISNGPDLRTQLITRNLLDYAMSPPLQDRLGGGVPS